MGFSLTQGGGPIATQAALSCFGASAPVSIGTFLAVADCGSGTEISRTLWSNLADIFSGSTPFGSANPRLAVLLATDKKLTIPNDVSREPSTTF